MSLTLVDSSAWISFLRGDASAVRRLDGLIAEGNAAICGPIFSELLSGATTGAQIERLKSWLGALEWIEPPKDVWTLVGESRFTLARVGHQASLVDLFIAHCARSRGAPLLTRDRDFQRLTLAVALDLAIF